MTDFIASPYVKELRAITNELYRHGWDERNGGNVSWLLKPEEVALYDVNEQGEEFDLGLDAQRLAGQYVLVTATGCYFKNVKDYPKRDSGLIKVAADGCHYQIVWGFEEGRRPTSELPTHIMGHLARLKQDSDQRVVMHCHPTNLVAMSFTQKLEEKTFSRTLWSMHPESIVVFPEGIGIIPYMTPGTMEIGQATAKKLGYYHTVLWPHHGMFATGRSIDEVYGLIETVEKSALIYTTIQAQGGKILQGLTDHDFLELGKRFNFVPNSKFINQ